MLSEESEKVVAPFCFGCISQRLKIRQTDKWWAARNNDKAWDVIRKMALGFLLLPSSPPSKTTLVQNLKDYLAAFETFLSSNRICDNSMKSDAGLLSQFRFIRIGLLQRFGTSVMPRAALRSSNLATSTNCLQSYHLSTRQRPEIAPFLGDEITARCCHFLWHKMVYIGFDGENMTGSYLYETIRIQMIQVSYERKMPQFLSIRKRQKNAFYLDIVCCIARGQYLYILKTP